MNAFRITLPSADEDVATAALWELGTAGLEVSDHGEDTRVLTAYFPDGGADAAALRAALGPVPGLEVEPVPVPDLDWVTLQRRDFRPLTVGRFRIAPSWDLPPEAEDVLIVDPGRAFGTGAHETTRLCLTLLQSIAARRPLGGVLDVGAGTGLLAVAAARLGARPAVAVDVDPDAIESARVHAALNRAALAIVRGDGGRPLQRGRFDIVMANLTAALLIERRGELASLRAPEGMLLMSGMLVEDLPEVRDAYQPYGAWDACLDGGWAAAVVERRGA